MEWRFILHYCMIRIPGGPPPLNVNVVSIVSTILNTLCILTTLLFVMFGKRGGYRLNALGRLAGATDRAQAKGVCYPKSPAIGLNVQSH